jgi:hypothetical protein
MMRSLLLFSFLLLFSCNTHDHIPSDVIKPPQMQAIMWDMIRADNLASERSRRDSLLNLNSENLKLVNQVFAIHKVRKSDFDRSLLFYQNNPDLLRVVLDSIKVQQAKKKEKEKPVAPVVKPKSIFDSIPTGSSPAPHQE